MYRADSTSFSSHSCFRDGMKGYNSSYKCGWGLLHPHTEQGRLVIRSRSRCIDCLIIAASVLVLYCNYVTPLKLPRPKLQRLDCTLCLGHSIMSGLHCGVLKLHDVLGMSSHG